MWQSIERYDATGKLETVEKAYIEELEQDSLGKHCQKQAFRGP
jgi:hypothetical protein